MAQTDRLHRIGSLLAGGRCVARDRLLRECEVSLATLKRDIAFLRNRLGMPIRWDADGQGWRLDPKKIGQGAHYELPGLWFGAAEIEALLAMQHLLGRIAPGGLLEPHIRPLKQRLARILGSGAPREADIARRLRMLSIGTRRVELPQFQAVASALLRRRRIVIDYCGRASGERTERELSPQRLVHYRDNWYLDAWCHLRRALRSFSVDAIRQVRMLDDAEKAIEIGDAELDDQLGAGYGIFAGSDVRWTRLRFSAERARWVAGEKWHPNQRGRFDAQGRWLLDLPYADPRELVMDILRHVPEVEVLWPDELAALVRERLVRGLKKMDGEEAG